MGIVAKTLEKEPSSYVLKINIAGSNQSFGSKIFNGKWIRNISDLADFPDKDEILMKFYGEIYKDDTGKNIGKEVRYRKGRAERDLGKFTVASDLNRFGFDIGEYTIEKNCKRILTILANNCDKFLKETKEQPDVCLKINLRGYSRGGVAVSLAQEVFYNQYLSKLVESDRDKIKLYLTLIDPVPGPFKPNEYGYAEIDKKAVTRSVIMYSINSMMRGKTYFDIFTPQAVFGTDVVIVTNRGHCCGQYETTDINSKIKFNYNDKSYDYGELIDLPDGFYVNPYNDYEKTDLNKLEDKDAMDFEKEITAANCDKEKGEPNRAKKLIEILKNYFKSYFESLKDSNF